MLKPAEAVTPRNARERIIVALDTGAADDARQIVARLTGEVGAFKIGLQLFSAAGPEFVSELTSAGHKIFLDLKFHDIPNTVAAAAIAAARLGVWMFNVHASGGSQMMAAARTAVDRVCQAEKIPKPLVIGVTVLTSSTRETLQETGVDAEAGEQVLRLSRLAAGAKLDGVVASASESRMIRESAVPENFLIVTPGIRDANATADDQKRVTTLRQAIAAGSSYVVVGRPITGAADPREGLDKMLSCAE